jgi:hypothetical protein
MSRQHVSLISLTCLNFVIHVFIHVELIFVLHILYDKLVELVFEITCSDSYNPLSFQVTFTINFHPT